MASTGRKTSKRPGRPGSRPHARYLVDTQCLLWWYADAPQLPRAYRALLRAVEASGRPVAVAAISLWEIAKLVEKGRIAVPRPVEEYLRQVEENPAIEVLPLDAAVAAESTRLGPTFPRDPADQLVAATARVHGRQLLTTDRLIGASGAVVVVPF